MKKPTSRKGFIDDLLAGPAAAPAPAAAPEPAAPAGGYVRFASRLSPENHQALDRVAYWMPGRGAKYQTILNEALAAYFATHPDAQRPTPDEG